MRTIFSSGTAPCRPSEQSSSKSPGLTLCSLISGATKRLVPIERLSTLLRRRAFCASRWEDTQPSLLIDHRVVPGQQLWPSVPDEVAARVAHMRDGRAIKAQCTRHHGGGDAAVSRLVDPVIRRLNRTREQRRGFSPGSGFGALGQNGLHRQLRGDFAAFRPPTPSASVNSHPRLRTCSGFEGSECPTKSSLCGRTGPQSLISAKSMSSIADVDLNSCASGERGITRLRCTIESSYRM